MELMKTKEIHELRRADHHDQLMKEKAMMNSFKERVARKYIINDSVRKDVQENLKLLQQQSPVNHLQLGL